MLTQLPVNTNKHTHKFISAEETKQMKSAAVAVPPDIARWCTGSAVSVMVSKWIWLKRHKPWCANNREKHNTISILFICFDVRKIAYFALDFDMIDLKYVWIFKKINTLSVNKIGTFHKQYMRCTHGIESLNVICSWCFVWAHFILSLFVRRTNIDIDMDRFRYMDRNSRTCYQLVKICWKPQKCWQ